MGKKSRRKKNNKSLPCYHGCITKKDFYSVEHHKVLEGWDNKKVVKNEFYKTHKRVMDDATFSCFVIARITEDYMKEKDDEVLHFRLLLLLDLRYLIIPTHEGKDVGPESENMRNYRKYRRDIHTTSKRGRIKCIAREIPCDCMEAKRIEAKSMEKVAICYCCEEDFLKGKMLRCTGCDRAQYCSKECYKKDWPRHKTSCRKTTVPLPS